MGLNKDEGRRIYLSIREGQFALKHKEPQEGKTKSRVNKLGSTVHEEFFKSFTGRLRSLVSKDTSYGKMWEIIVADEKNQEYVISWNYSSRYTDNLFRRLPNIDLSKDLKIAPWTMKNSYNADQMISGLTIYQEGHPDGKVPWAFTDEEPGKMPAKKKIKIKGKEETDDSDRLEFFEELAKTANEKIKSISGPGAAEQLGEMDDDDDEKPDGWPFVEPDESTERAF